jgi:tRNA-uridine 2-sulfurtransferase
MSQKVAVALSGGVDSSVAALVLLEQGFEVVGVTMLLHDECGRKDAKSCCAYEDVILAREVSKQLKMEHFVLDLRELFSKTVAAKFLEGLRRGVTPNPCVICNEEIKFKFMFEWASGINARFIATGHYARIIKSEGECGLLRGSDHNKDQSYFLFRVPGDILKSTIFPIGGEIKASVRQKAKEAGLPTSEKAESQDICFGSGEPLASYFERAGIRQEEGPVCLCGGERIGTHKGLSNFTVGQRKGIAVPYKEPLYVIKIDKEKNVLTVGPKQKALKRRFKVKDWFWRGADKADSLDIQVRYRQKPLKARIEEAAGVFSIEWADEMEIAAPGQAAVGYIGDKVAGGGWIAEDEDD